MKMGTDPDLPLRRSILSRFVRSGSVPILICMLAAPLAFAQQMYKWKDEKGVWHFSENPPPDGSKADKIEVKPIQPDRAPVDNWKQKEQEARERRAKEGVAAEQTRKQEESQRGARCRAAQRKADTMENYARVFRLNEKGERVYMEEKEKASELADARRDISKYCD